MSDQREHGITWTDTTWNPIRGCSRVSEGCRNCYAERVAHRFSGPGQPYEGLVRIANGHPQWTGEVRVVDEHMLDPLRWRRPRRIFVNSMSDLFHENVSDETIDRIVTVMLLAYWHEFQILTKRARRAFEYFISPRVDHVIGELVDFQRRGGIADSLIWKALDMRRRDRVAWPQSSILPNVWMGVSVENQAAADERIPLLLQTPVAVRWISAEPLLGPINLEELPSVSGIGRYLDSLSNAGAKDADIPTKLDWVVVGGESGPGARPMHSDWARSLRDQCVAAGVAFHFKQWGEWAFSHELPNETEWGDGEALVSAISGDIRGHESLTDETAVVMKRVGKRAAGRLLDGREWNEYPAQAEKESHG